jgi:glyoxylase-like metal-dependent hydrolase (beta-lactamase superfamily II)
MMKNKVLLFLFTCLLHLTFVVAQDEEVTIGVDTLSKEVYMLTGQGGNIGIFVGKDNVFMIDDQFDRLSEKIKSAIATLTDKPIAILFNTHMHGDHTGGNSKFNSKATTIVAHDNVRKTLHGQQSGNSAFDEKMLPEITFSDDITFHDGEETIMAFHVHNAHTDGDAMVFFLENNVLHMGDTYFAERYPFIDLKSGGSVEGYINAHKKALLLINESTKIIPGHGRPSNKAELQKYVAMLETIKSKVEAAIAARATLEEVIKDTSLTEAFDEVHGNGFIKPEALRETFYISLKGN